MANYTVTTLVDEAFGSGNLATETADGAGLSLREALGLALANGAGTLDKITFDAALAGSTITIGGTELVIASSVAIDGDTNGDGKADITISGSNASRVFNVTQGSSTIEALTITEGNAAGDKGGGIALTAGSLALINSTVSGNSAAYGGGGIYSAVGSGLTLINSTVSGNYSRSSGGGIYAKGDIAAHNTTVFGNTAEYGFGGGILSQFLTRLFNSTVSGNTAVNGAGGIYSSGTLYVTNSIVAGNTSNWSTDLDAPGTNIFQGKNLFSQATGGGAGDLHQADLGKIFVTGALEDNGGPVKTVLILAQGLGGVAENAGNKSFLPADGHDIDGDGNTTEVLPLDARGFSRVSLDLVDIGAVELQDVVPSDIALSVTSVNENAATNTVVGALTVTDPDLNDPRTFSIVGADGRFKISGTNLVVDNGVLLDREAATSHSVTIRVTNSHLASYDEAFSITVNDLNDVAPVVTTGASQSIAETATIVAALTSTDADSVGTNPRTFSITGGTDAALFDVVGGNLVFKAARDFETQAHSYAVEVSAFDGIHSTPKTITVAITDANDTAPVVTTTGTHSIAENQAFSTALTATDADGVGGPVTYSITGGANQALFAINSGNLELAARDFETQAHSYVVEVSAFDGINSTPKTFTVNLTDVNDTAPIVTTPASRDVTENTTFVAALTSTDADTVGTSPATFAITGGADAALFKIAGGNLVFKAARDFETQAHSYAVEVSAFDGVNTSPKAIAIKLIDSANENAPVITTAATQTVAENTTIVAALTSTDVDTVGTNPAKFSITGGPDASLFTISGGNLIFKAAHDFDTEAHSYSVRVGANDGSHTTNKTITVNLTNEAGVTITGTKKNDLIDATHTPAGQPLPTNEEDTILGGNGKDKLFGLGGNDRISGGAKNDKLTGGEGADTFVFDAKLKKNVDKILDFAPGEDTIELAHKVFKKIAVGALDASDFGSGKKAAAKDKHAVYYNEKKGVLYADMNGHKPGGDLAFAKVAKHLDLSADDFLIA